MEIETIAHQLLEECGYKSGSTIRSINGWYRASAVYCDIINYPLIFTIGIHKNGSCWISASKDRKKINLHDPKSIDILKEKLIKIREEHHATYSRLWKTQ